MLKIRSTPTDGEQKAQMRQWSTETQNVKSHVPAIPYGNRDCMIENSQRHSSSNNVQPPLPTLDLIESENLENFSENHCAQMVLQWKMHLMHHLHQEHARQHVRALEASQEV